MYSCEICKVTFCENCVKLSVIAYQLRKDQLKLDKEIPIDVSNELVDSL